MSQKFLVEYEEVSQGIKAAFDEMARMQKENPDDPKGKELGTLWQLIGDNLHELQVYVIKGPIDNEENTQ